MTPVRMLANVVAGMLLVQVILGGAATVLSLPVVSHLAWGIISFIAVIALTALIVGQYGTRSAPFRISIALVVDFVIQGVLGYSSLNSNDGLLVHLTNAFVLMALLTTLIGVLARTQPVAKVVNPASPA